VDDRRQLGRWDDGDAYSSNTDGDPDSVQSPASGRWACS
jgi:hypothetical protein